MVQCYRIQGAQGKSRILTQNSVKIRLDKPGNLWYNVIVHKGYRTSQESSPKNSVKIRLDKYGNLWYNKEKAQPTRFDKNPHPKGGENKA